MSTDISILTRLDGKSIREILRDGPRFVRDTIKQRVRATYYRRRLHADRTQRRERRREAITRLVGGDFVLFLCHGNICRSPFAERYARAQFESRGLDGVSFGSAGFTNLSDPTSPADARAVATKHGVDLDDHRAVQATRDAIARADLLLLMDYRNYHSFTTRYPEAEERMFLLRLFDTGGAMQIPDPYGTDRETFTTVYDQIRRCIDTLVRVYENHGSRTDPPGESTSERTDGWPPPSGEDTSTLGS